MGKGVHAGGSGNMGRQANNQGRVQRGGGRLDADTVASPGSWEAAVRAAGAAVAAAESAIGLAILVVLFRNLRSIDVEDLGSLKG